MSANYAVMTARGLDRLWSMLAGIALYLMLVQNGCMKPMLPGEQLTDDQALEQIALRPVPKASRRN